MKKSLISKTFYIAGGILLLVETPVHALDVTVSAGAATATIQAAIDQVSAAGGGTVNLAKGNFYLTQTLNMKNGVTLSGAGTPATGVTIGGNFAGIQAPSEGMSNLTIRNMKLVGTGSAGSSSCQGIMLTAPGYRNFYHSNITLSNLQVMNCGGMGVQIERANGVNITNCNIHHNAGFDLNNNLSLRDCNSVTISATAGNDSPKGAGLKVSGVCQDITINGSTFSNNGLQGVNVMDAVDNVTLQNSSFNYNGRFNSTQADGISFSGTNALIVYNTCSSNAGSGIRTTGGYGTVSNNTVSGNTGGSYNISNGFTLPVNPVTLNVPAGAATATIQSAIDQVSAAGGGTVNLAAGSYSLTTTLNMKNNVKLNGAGRPATSITIGNFTGIGASSEGLYNLTVQNLKLVGTGEQGSTNCHGIIFSSGNTYFTNVTISNVEIAQCGGMGAHFKRVNGINILNANIHNSGGFAYMHNLYLYSCNSAYINEVQSTDSFAGMGLHINGNNNNINVYSSTFSSNAGFGIYVQTIDGTFRFSDINVTLQGNTCNGNGNSSGNHSDGIKFTGTNGRIDSNTCNNNLAAGIRTGPNGSGYMNNNTATGNPAGNYVIQGWWWGSNNN